MSKTFTCFFCDTSMECPVDGQIRMCPCGMFRVQCEVGFDRFISTLPKEQLTAEQVVSYARIKVNIAARLPSN